MKIEVNTQPNEDLYYYYMNWRAHQDNKIHKATCGYCNYGTGMHQNVNRGENGVWVGPFSSLDLCIEHVQNKLNLPPNLHVCCE